MHACMDLVTTCRLMQCFNSNCCCTIQLPAGPSMHPVRPEVHDPCIALDYCSSSTSGAIEL